MQGVGHHAIQAAAALAALATMGLLIGMGWASGRTYAPPHTPPALEVVAPPRSPAGALVLAREDRDLAVAISVLQRGARLELQTTVLGPDGNGLGGLSVAYTVRATTGTEAAAASTCSDGCYRGFVPSRSRPRLVSVRLRGAGRDASRVDFTMPARWPPQPAVALVGRAVDVFRSLRTVAFRERLASSPGHAVMSTWQLKAPDRFAYQIPRGPQAIIVGNRRWDREPGGPWRESTQTRIHVPTPLWSSVVDPHLIGTRRVGGKPAWLVSFYDPRLPIFFTLAIEKRTLRTLDARMTAASHFMDDRYSDFNGPIRIEPPR